MRQQTVSVVFALFACGPALAGDKLQLPPEVTPELRGVRGGRAPPVRRCQSDDRKRQELRAG